MYSKGEGKEEDLEPFCGECGAKVGMFIGYDGWHHFRGEGTPANPNRLYDPGHDPVVAWRENLSKKSSNILPDPLDNQTDFRYCRRVGNKREVKWTTSH